MNIRESLANLINELSNTEESEGVFFPFLITDFEGLKSAVRRPLETFVPYVQRGGYDGSASDRFLIIGAPGSGKTREAIEIISKLDRLRPRTILYSSESLQIPTKIPSSLSRDSLVVIFIDDFGQDCVSAQKRPPTLATRGGFPRPLDKLQLLVNTFESHFKDVVIIITINRAHYDALIIEDESHNLLLQFKKIELKEFSPRQLERFVQTISKATEVKVAEDDVERLMKMTYGSVSGLAYFFQTLQSNQVKELKRENIHHYYELFKAGWDLVIKQFETADRSILQALAILKKYLILPHKDLVFEVAKEIDKGFFLQKGKKLQEAYDHLLGRVFFEHEEIILCYESLLPEGEALSLNQFVKTVLAYSKKKREKARIRNSLLNLSDRLLDQAEIDLNIQVCTQLLELLPNHPECYYNLGTLKAAKNLTDEAEKYFLEMIKRNNKDPLAYYNYAVFLSDQKLIDKAHEQYLKALALSPNDADIHFKLASILMAQKKLPDAEKEFQRGIELNPFDAAARNNFGVLLRSVNKISQAEHQYRQAISIDPTYARAYKNLGTLLSSQGRVQDAKKMYNKALELDPNDAMTHFNLGVLLPVMNEPDEAEAEYRKAIQLDPSYSRTYNNLGTLLFNQNRLDEAEAMFLQAIKLDKDFKDAHYNLTLVYERKGDSDKAIEHWEAITRGD